MLDKKYLLIIATLVAIVSGWYFWQQNSADQTNSAFISSNGRIEATEIDIATKIAGRVSGIFVDEGAFVKKGDLLATMQVDSLEAQHREANAQRAQAINAVATAEAQVAMRKSDKTAVLAQLAKAEAEYDAAKKRFDRTKALANDGAISEQTLEDDQVKMQSAKATLEATKAQVVSADASIVASEVQVVSAKSQVEAIDATIDRIEVEIEDSKLKAPRDGRVQYRVAQVGEVLSAGGRVMNLLDLSDVYMTFFLPTEVAGRLALGADVRILLDAAPDYPIPAKISFVASAAQFTPKTVETASERQKLMFRVRAQIDKALLQKHIEYVKTGLPAEVWIRLDDKQEWLPRLQTKFE